jgi:citrate synthase
MSDKALLQYQDKTFEFPVIQGSENELAIDIKTLRAQSGMITIDPGYKNTGSCESAITFLDGEKGILRYRGTLLKIWQRKRALLKWYIY